MYKVTQTYDNEYVGLIIVDCDGDVRTYEDKMEPEDAAFSRDLSWIVVELERAYDQGREDGYSDGYDHGSESGYNRGYDFGSTVYDDA